MRAEPRVAFFPDSYLEVNGVAHTSRHLVANAKREGRPLLCVHAGAENHREQDGSVERLMLQRSRVGFRLDADLRFDLLFWRHAGRVLKVVREFDPDVIHLTGPSDVGLLGAWVAWRLRRPIVLSWHTNLHEYAERRLTGWVAWLSPSLGTRMGEWGGTVTWGALVQFYRLGRVLLATHEELVRLLAEECQRPTFLMRRGVDTDLFTPEKREEREVEARGELAPLTLGYVGRLTPEKNVRQLAEIEQELHRRGKTGYRFVIVGTGSEEAWLRERMRRAEFRGVLRGEALARAYAGMDLFLFPSRTDTFGNVVLEAQASGVPAVVTSSGGPHSIIVPGETGLVADTVEEFCNAIESLRKRPNRRVAMARAARQLALPRTWEGIFQEVNRAYALCVEKVASDPASSAGATQVDSSQP
ncbi:MAG: glycosyltransferase [Blastocatellia bacterium]|jgi:glycosyltransferase involved in cell wall biosynthesis